MATPLISYASNCVFCACRRSGVFPVTAHFLRGATLFFGALVLLLAASGARAQFQQPLVLLSRLLQFRNVYNQSDYAPPILPKNFALPGIFVALATVIFFAGCGGGASSPPQAQIVTPQGTSTITVMPSAKNAAGQLLQLSPIQLTLTVN